MEGRYSILFGMQILAKTRLSPEIHKLLPENVF